MDLFVDNTGGAFIGGLKDTSRLDPIRLGENIVDTLCLWLLDRPTSSGLPMIPAVIPAPFTTVVVAARLQDDLETGSELFTVTGFTPVALGAIAAISAPAAVAITDSSVASPTVLTAVAHGLLNGDSVVISGHGGSVPAISGTYPVTRLSDDAFSIPLDVTTGGTGGTAQKLTATQITTTESHGLTTGETVTIAGAECVPTINGTRVATVTGAATFTVPVPVTTAGTGGTFASTTRGHYEADIDLDNAAIHTAVAGKKSIAVLIGVELTNGDATRNRRLIFQAGGTIFRDVYRPA